MMNSSGSMLSKGDQTRLRIMEAMIESVAKYGFEFSTATTISKMARVNRGLIVHYFSTIEKLTKEAMTLLTTYMYQRTNELMAENADKIEDPIERYLTSTLDWIQERPHYAQFFVFLITRASYQKQTRETVNVVYTAGRARLKKIIEEGNKAGIYKCKDPEQMALQIHAMLMGNILSFLLDSANLTQAKMLSLQTAHHLLSKKK